LSNDVRFEVELTHGAQGDLEDIHSYLCEQDASGAADRLLDGFLELVGTLEQFPMRGAIPRELEALGIKEYRQLLLKPYRIIYRIIGSTVFIFLIADGRRDMQSLLERRLLRR